MKTVSTAVNGSGASGISRPFCCAYVLSVVVNSELVSRPGWRAASRSPQLLWRQRAA